MIEDFPLRGYPCSLQKIPLFLTRPGLGKIENSRVELTEGQVFLKELDRKRRTYDCRPLGLESKSKGGVLVRMTTGVQRRRPSTLSGIEEKRHDPLVSRILTRLRVNSNNLLIGTLTGLDSHVRSLQVHPVKHTFFSIIW